MNITYRYIRDMASSNTREFIGKNHEIIYVNYDRAFTDFDYINHLVSRLGIEMNSEISGQLKNFIKKSEKLVLNPRHKISASLCAALRDGIDHAAAEAVCEITGIDVLNSIRSTTETSSD